MTPAGARGSFAQWIRNLRAGDLPLGHRLATMTRNYSLRLTLRRACCGHPGEPGC